MKLYLKCRADAMDEMLLHKAKYITIILLIFAFCIALAVGINFL